MRIAVLGGGHGCYAAAAEMSEKGHEVWLWRRDAAAFDAIHETGGIEVRDHAGTRIVPIAHLTSSGGSHHRRRTGPHPPARHRA
jgi:opine dehydrogenase